MPSPPVIVYDTNRDALARRVAAVRVAAPQAAVTGTSSRSAALLLAEAAPAGAPILVDLFTTDRMSVDRPGIRLIRRLSRNMTTGHARPVAWSAQAGPDVLRSVRLAGAHGFVTASLDAADEQHQLGRALAGEAVWPPARVEADRRADAAWQTWFAQAFGVRWEPWIEPVLVRLASGRERRAVTSELVDLKVAQSAGHAATRMRDIAHAIVGEHRNSPSEVAAGASLVLAQIATHRALDESPAPGVSLEHGVRIIATSPSLVRAAGVTEDEVEELRAIHTLIEAKRLRSPARPGAPAADQVLHERMWAAGHRAAENGAGKDELADVTAGTLTGLDESLRALDDARQDQLYHPEAHAAAALSLLTAGHADQLPGIENDGGHVCWQGRSVTELAVATDLPVDELQAFATSVDALLLEAAAPVG